MNHGARGNKRVFIPLHEMGKNINAFTADATPAN